MDDIRLFLKQHIFNPTKAGKCREMVLRHVDVGGKLGSEVQRWDIEKLHESTEGIGVLLTEIQTVADRDAAGLSGVQRYALQAFHGDNERQTARRVFRVDGDSGEEDDNLSSEGASVKGALAQQMRHNEIIMKTSMTTVAQVMQTLQRTCSQQAQRIETMEAERIQNLSVFEKLMSEQHMREIEARKLDLREKSMMEVVSSLKKALPFVAQKFLSAPGKKDGEKSGADMALEGILTVFGSMSPEQKATLFATLNDEQRELLQNVFAVSAN